VTSIGDRNGDGSEEYAVGEPGAAMVHLFDGATGAAAGEILSPGAPASDAFGASVARGDNYDAAAGEEFWVGAPAASKAYLMSQTGGVLVEVTDPTPEGADASDAFGALLATTGDIGGDPERDVLIGNPGEMVGGAEHAGAAFLVLAKTNHPPVASAGADQTVECTGPNGSAVTLDGSASFDPDGDPLTYEWTNDGGEIVGTAAIVTLDVPLGIQVFTLTVTDDDGESASDTATITVADSIAPALTMSLVPAVLWPPNHKLRSVAAAPSASDACDPTPAVTLVSVESSEPDDGLGDGDTAGDVQGAEAGTDDRAFQLRAERAGKSGGRVYTAVYSAEDSSGNGSTASAAVTVAR
jgi:hypothetical protein